MSVGYDPFYWLERELDQEHEAFMNGYDDVDEYLRHKYDEKQEAQAYIQEERI